MNITISRGRSTETPEQTIRRLTTLLTAAHKTAAKDAERIQRQDEENQLLAAEIVRLTDVNRQLTEDNQRLTHAWAQADADTDTIHVPAPLDLPEHDRPVPDWQTALAEQEERGGEDTQQIPTDQLPKPDHGETP